MRSKRKLYSSILVVMIVFFYVNPIVVYAHNHSNSMEDQKRAEEDFTIEELKSEMAQEAIEILNKNEENQIVEILKEDLGDKLESSEILDEVKQMSLNYDKINSGKKDSASDSRYVNDMLIKQEETTKEIE